jgi:hypothetical protein
MALELKSPEPMNVTRLIMELMKYPPDMLVLVPPDNDVFEECTVPFLRQETVKVDGVDTQAVIIY